MLQLSKLHIITSKDELRGIPEGKVLINTINAHSFNVAQKDELFAESLTPNPSPKGEGDANCEGDTKGDAECVKYLIPDGASIIKACHLLKAKSQPKERIAGWDLFIFEMERLNDKGKMTNDKLRVMFLGSSEEVLALIRERAAVDYPHLDIITYSPPFKPEFSDEDNQTMIQAINDAAPDLLWIGMTAPKQEKWTYQHWDELNIHCHCGTVGAVFDFYAGTVKRAPLSWQRNSMEWLHRLIMEPRRMWRRYIIGAVKFLYNISKEFIND
jgi:N-acetylglucosaminyldiphosphoundecaprenol N-acetyl-beta-D-mannosaminyltransferase